MTCIPPNPRRVGYIVPTHGLLDGPLYTWAQYTPTDDVIHQVINVFICIEHLAFCYIVMMITLSSG